MPFVYLLISTKGNTYVGATVSLERRLRQHNQEIKGGARATGCKVLRGETWTRAAHVSGFPNWKAALQFEWRWKQLSRTLSFSMMPLERRLRALHMLIQLPQSTSKATPFAEWSSPPEIHLETDSAREIMNAITSFQHESL